jgi:hypothetical protein
MPISSWLSEGASAVTTGAMIDVDAGCIVHIELALPAKGTEMIAPMQLRDILIDERKEILASGPAQERCCRRRALFGPTLAMDHDASIRNATTCFGNLRSFCWYCGPWEWSPRTRWAGSFTSC